MTMTKNYQKKKNPQKQKTHNNLESMGCSKKGFKRDVYSNTILFLETRKPQKRQPNFTPKTTGKRRKKAKTNKQTNKQNKTKNSTVAEGEKS